MQNAFSIRDRNSAWKHNVNLCATKSDKILKFHPEEASLASLFDTIMALELQLSEVQGVTTTHSGQINKNVVADIEKMKIDMVSNAAERQTISQTWCQVCLGIIPYSFLVYHMCQLGQVH